MSIPPLEDLQTIRIQIFAKYRDSVLISKNQENLGPLEILVNFAKETGIKVKDKTKFLSIWSDLILPSNNPVLQNMWRFSQGKFRLRL